MKNELQPVSTANLSTAEVTAANVPATVVNQNGEKNVHIDRADTVNQNITFKFPYIARTSDGRMQPTARNINRNYYNLFVMGAEPFDSDHFIVPPDRALSPYWTSDELRNELGELSDEAIEKIKTFPALFLPEANDYYAKASDEQQVIFGFLDSVRVQDNGIKIRYQPLWPIPMQQISNIGFDLGMKDMTRAITEMNHTHWAIKRINLMEELNDAGISLFGF